MAKKKKPSIKQMATEGVQAALESTRAAGLVGDGTVVVVPVIVVIRGIVNIQQGAEFEGGDTEG